MKAFLISFLLVTFLNGFDSLNKGHIDSMKPLVASALKNNGGQDTATINRLNKLAFYYFKLNPDSTLYYGHISTGLARKINYMPGLANGLLQTGHADFFKGSFAQAKLEFDEAISIFKKLKDKHGLSECYELYGRMYNLQSEYKLALSFLNQALELDKQQRDKTATADSYKNIGMVYFGEGQLSTALDFYYKALSLDEEAKDKHATAAIYNNIGDVLQNMDAYPKALEFYKKALQLYYLTNDLEGVGTADENIGEVLLAQKKYEDAISYLTKSINIAIKQDDKDGMSYVYADLGLCYTYKNQANLAAKYLTNAIEISSKYKITYNQAYAFISYSTFLNLQKDYKDACKYAIRGQALANQLGNVWFRGNAALQLHKSYAGLGKFQEAYKYSNQYSDLKDSLKSTEGIQKLTSYSLNLNFASKQHKAELQQLEKDITYKQKIKQQRLILSFGFIIVVMAIITVFYYRQKTGHLKTIAILGDKNNEILKQKADLNEAAQKLSGLNTLKDRLIGILAHDLRTPLSTLKGVFELFQDKTLTMDEMLAMIPNIIRKLEYTSDFLDTLLFWINSQVENADPVSKSFDLRSIAAYEIINHSEQAESKGIRLIDRISEPAIASADPESIRIVIRNLITNAIKFSRENDTIEISARLHSDKYYNEEYYVVTVKDTGVGMSDKQVERLFKGKVSSGTGTNNESGTGMGMMFCRDLVEKSGGKIWVNSRPGYGTEFSFTLPVGIVPEESPAVELSC